MPAPGLLAYESGGWQINLARRELRLRGKPVPLGGRAFDIVEVLIQSAGELVTKDDLMSCVWPGSGQVGEPHAPRCISRRFVWGPVLIVGC